MSSLERANVIQGVMKRMETCISKTALCMFSAVFVCCAYGSAHKTQKVEIQRLHEIREISVCGVKIEAEVARGAEDQARGLMGRSGLPEGTGMIFIADRERIVSFWM